MNEAVYGISRADFIAKLQISLKEMAETEYWLRLLIMYEYITNDEGESLLNECLENICRKVFCKEVVNERHL